MKSNRIVLFYIVSFILMSNIGVSSQCIAQTHISKVTSFEQQVMRLKLNENKNDYSEAKEIETEEPACAYMNITGIDKMPEQKGISNNVWVEVYLGGGKYFRKRAIIGAQGNSSMSHPKKNFKLDFCEDEWLGEKTTDFKFGNWVKQDGFHFKSYYIDYLRGVGAVGYKIFHQMTESGGGYPWTRAINHLTKVRKNARCYSDGFPCIVYLNEEFYGIFSWQIKKSRENMNMTKDIAEHIHLDGTLSDGTIWKGVVDWKGFDVRNPKVLYDIDGKRYDGDNPNELIDESSEYFILSNDDTPTKDAKQRTAKVKHYIEAFSQLVPKLKSMEAGGADVNDIRAAFEANFDVTSMIDYACFHLAVNNWDGFRKNWQWFTYDGTKWFVAPYDLDCIMGNFFTGTFVFGSDIHLYVPTDGPFYFISNYYKKEIANRYSDLRESGVLSFFNMQSLLENWYNRIGEDVYAEEWKRWPDSKCISETVTNHGWKQSTYANINRAKEYNDVTVYVPGEYCMLDNVVWEATETVCGVKPYVQLGYTDSLERYENYLLQRQDMLSKMYNIQDNQQMVLSVFIPVSGWTILCLPFCPENLDDLTFYSLNTTESSELSLMVNAVEHPKAHTPYLVTGQTGYYCLRGIKDESASGSLADNYLQGTYSYRRVPTGNYVLAEKGGQAVFVRVALQDSTYVPAYHGFANLSNIYGDEPELTFSAGGTIQDVMTLDASCSQKKTIYDITGRKLMAPASGLNIIHTSDGTTRKVIIKANGF